MMKKNNRPNYIPPHLHAIHAAWKALSPHIRTTPVVPWNTLEKSKRLADSTEVMCKLECIQHTGTFKVRAALHITKQLSTMQKKQGIVTISAGNHAIATAYAARMHHTHAKVVVPSSANPYRIKQCKAYGAEIIYCDSIVQGFDICQRIAEREKRYMLHPFEGYGTTLGTATLGFEFIRQVPDLDAIVVQVGGGGLLSGIACAAYAMNPAIAVYGVEPLEADVMFQSYQAGHLVEITPKPAIADSLSPPKSLPYSFHNAFAHTRDVVRVREKQIIDSMKLLFEDCKLGLEPATATALAGLLGPLKHTLHGKKVGVLICGSNIDTQTFTRILNEKT